MTRGPLPPRVYWTRRVVALVVVLGLAVGLVGGVIALAARFSGGPSAQPDRAAPVAAEPSQAPTDSASAGSDREKNRDGRENKNKNKKKKARDRGPVLAEPDGVCNDRDIAVTPTVEEPVGGSSVVFTLDLRTVLSPACTWEVSPRSLSVKVTSGKDDIWFSTQCRGAIPTEDVVIRNNVGTAVEVTWSGRRSNDGCVRSDWALPGWYHVEAAALAGEPSDLQFRLAAPEAPVETKTVSPDPKQGKNGKQNQGKKKRDDAG